MGCWKLSYDKQTYKQPAQFTTKKHNYILAYVDDIDIDGRSQSAVQDAYLALEREAAKVGLKINEEKTKCMIAARNDRTISDVEQCVAIGDKHFEVVKEFLYMVTPTNDVSLEIQRRIQTVSSDCGNICSRASFYARQNSSFKSPALRQWDVGVDQNLNQVVPHKRVSKKK
jgi:hypothetical protein